MDRPRAPRLLEPATTREAEPCDARGSAPSRANVRSRRRAWRCSRHVWRGWDVVPRHAVEFVQPSLRTRRTCRIMQRFVRRRGNAASTRSEGACGYDSSDVRGASQNVHRNRSIDVDPRRWREEEGDGGGERRRSFPSCFRRSCSSHACARTAFDVCEDQVHGGVRTSIPHRYGVVQLQASWSCFHVVLRRRSSTSTPPRNLRWHGTRFDVLGTPPCTCASLSSVRRSTSIRRCRGVLPSPHMQQAAATTSSNEQQLRDVATVVVPNFRIWRERNDEGPKSSERDKGPLGTSEDRPSSEGVQRNEALIPKEDRRTACTCPRGDEDE